MLVVTILVIVTVISLIATLCFVRFGKINFKEMDPRVFIFVLFVSILAVPGILVLVYLTMTFYSSMFSKGSGLTTTKAFMAKNPKLLNFGWFIFYVFLLVCAVVFIVFGVAMFCHRKIWRSKKNS